MSTHPLIAHRGVQGPQEPFVLGTGLAVWEIEELVRAQGSIEAASDLLRLDPRLVGAAVDYYNDVGTGAVSPSAPAKDPKPTLELVTQAFSLFAGIATVVYFAGGVVLAFRLFLQNLPWEPVVAQLPREFLISTGAGQVLFPALLVGGLYGLFRLLPSDRPRTPPRPPRWSYGWRRRPPVVACYLSIAGLLCVPVGLVELARHFVEPMSRPRLLLLALGYAAMLIPAIAAHEVRALVAARRALSWRAARTVAVVASVYATAAVPAVMLAASALPLNEGKVCANGEFEEQGSLVGQTSDRIYLGEPGEENRRLAVFPLSQVQEIFIGSGAGDAECDFDGARRAIVAAVRAEAGERAAREATRAAEAVSAAGDDAALIPAAIATADTAAKSGKAALQLAGLAQSVRATGSSAEKGALTIERATTLRRRVDALEGSRGATRASLRDAVRGDVRAVVEAAQSSSAELPALATAILDAARAGQPFSE